MGTLLKAVVEMAKVTEFFNINSAKNVTKLKMKSEATVVREYNKQKTSCLQKKKKQEQDTDLET